MTFPRVHGEEEAARGEGLSNASTAQTPANEWSVSRRGSVIEVGYGHGSDFPQYAALHSSSGFLRLNCGPRCAWGTSIVLLPSFWSDGVYHQGAHVDVAWRHENTDLVISFYGSISTLCARGEIRIAPPASESITGTVMVRVDGGVNLSRRPREAFKPVVLSSMHASPDYWDANAAEVGRQSFRIPDWGWIVEPSVFGRRFALKAGTSRWKTNAPAIELLLSEAREIAGWKSESSDPDDDNLSLWATTDEVLECWEYAFTAKLQAD